MKMYSVITIVRETMNYRLIIVLIVVYTFLRCGGKNTDSNVDAPGGKQTINDKILESGAAVIQDKTPLKNFNVYLDGFHFYNGNMQAQMEAHHYVSQLDEDMYQAIIFDGNESNAKIMGIEYIITEKLFKNLPEEEKYLWHSHQYEVKSGTLVAPGIPEAIEHQLMEKLVATYGKTIHTWHTDQQRNLPLGAPMIMMGFTKPGQLHGHLVSERDQRFDISTEKIKKSREDIPVLMVDIHANAWEKGIIRQLTITNKADSAHHKHQLQ
jgi:hypothetical protein